MFFLLSVLQQLVLIIPRHVCLYLVFDERVLSVKCDRSRRHQLRSEA